MQTFRKEFNLPHPIGDVEKVLLEKRFNEEMETAKPHVKAAEFQDFPVVDPYEYGFRVAMVECGRTAFGRIDCDESVSTWKDNRYDRDTKILDWKYRDQDRDVHISGSYALNAVGNESKITLTINIKVKGILGRMIERKIKETITQETNDPKYENIWKAHLTAR